MKSILTKSLIGLFTMTIILLWACKKQFPHQEKQGPTFEERALYSTPEQFKQAMAKVANLISANQVIAFLDTTQDGYPDVRGRQVPLEIIAFHILSKLENNQLEQAVYDIFHFDGETFSLISFLMKARMAGNISAQTLTDISAEIPLPPFAVANFIAPVINVPVDTPEVNCCDFCNPDIKIKVTWVYKPACGNYEKEVSGYAAGNTLTNMSGGRMYKFSAEVTGDPCPGGVLTSSVTAPAGASYGYSTSKDGSVTLFPGSSGTYTITFTYKNCGKTVSKTFTLTVK